MIRPARRAELETLGERLVNGCQQFRGATAQGEFRNAQSWLRRKKVDLTAESTWGHLSIAPGRKVVVFQSQSSWYRP